MGVSSFLYNIFIYPIEFILETSFYFFRVYTKSSYIVSIFFISLVVNFISLPLYNIAERWQQKERDIQNKMKPMIDNIKSVFKGDQRYLLIRTCQRINGYKTIYAFRGTLGLLIQIPFFIAAYHFMNNLDGLEFAQFGIITNLAKPDAMLKIGNISINVLPFIMTAVSFLASLVYSKKLTLKEQLPLYVTNLIFLVLLYNSPAGLLFYWTVNCTFSLVKNIVINNYSYLKNLCHSIIKNKIFLFLIKLILYLFTLFIIVYTLGYLFRDDIYRLSTKNNELIKFRISEKTYFDVLSIWIFIFIIILYKKYLYNLFSISINHRMKLLLFSSISITLLSGLFIPTALIGTSAQEFNEPFNLIFINFFRYIGFFLVYPIIIYILFSDKIKYNISIFFVYLSAIFFVDTFLMYGNYGHITNNFIFDKADLLNVSIYQKFLNILVIFIFILLLFYLMKKNKIMLIININIIISLSLLSISVYDLLKINREQIILSDIYKDSNNALDTKNFNNIFKLSKTGTNVFVILLDRASAYYINETFKNFPELKEKMPGFILYTNTLSASENTTGSVSAVMGGYEYIPYEISLNGTFNLRDKYNEGILVMPTMFTRENYTANILNATFVNLNYGYDISIFATNNNINAYSENYDFIKYCVSNFLNENIENPDIEEIKSIYDKTIYNDKSSIESKSNIDRAFRFSLFRIMPYIFRKKIYSNGEWYISTSLNSIELNKSIHEYSILYSLKNITSIEENGNYFNFTHNNTTHEPHNFNKDFLPSIWAKNIPDDDLKEFAGDFNARTYYANVASMKVITLFLDFLRENDVYDNTKIIFVSDHSLPTHTEFYVKNGLEFMSSFHSLFMYKDFNATNEFTISSNFMTTSETPFVALSHLTNKINPFTGKEITNDYKNNGFTTIMLNEWQPNRQLENRFNFTKYYTVKGNIFDKNNWKLNTLQK
ncbi:YidC/Oxa1 family membrane protein insertase [Brachyspira intermedia]|uniref:YidC/Oxa1 family membrane protein insertase n=1 Tax=Brachyspira intermedia TaxID=84377 RepID=UPI003007D309